MLARARSIRDSRPSSSGGPHPPYFPSQGARRRRAGLTARHIETLELIADGLTNEQIALVLGVHIETAKSHVKRCLSGLDARNRAHAVAVAVRWGIIP